MTKLRLNKFLSSSGIVSRRKADTDISNGLVKVNGKVTKELGIKIDPEKDKVEYKNQLVSNSDNDKVYYALNKPKGIISTANDEMGRKTVLELVPKMPRVFPVGRLDANSEGLIILTNDGELAQMLTHPSFEHTKIYEVIARNNNHIPDNQIIKRMLGGLKVDGSTAKADNLEVIDHRGNNIKFRITLHTGHNRQIRKMCAKIGLEVAKLTRLKIANFSLDGLDLEPGHYVSITKDQII